MNAVHLSGSLAEQPLFNTLEKGVPLLRLKLDVQALIPGAYNDRVEILHINVVMYGPGAADVYPFLQKGAQISIFGYIGVRVHYENGSRKQRLEQEVVAIRIMPSVGADFARGLQRMERMKEEAAHQP
jgi:single-stranded DNA-binding protein